MKITNLKRILGLFFTLAVVGVLVTSCERENIIEKDINGFKTSIVEDELNSFKQISIEEDVEGVKVDEDIQPPLTMEELDELFITNPELFTENESYKNSGNCGCSHRFTSNASSTQRWVYCYNWDRNNRGNWVLFCTHGVGNNYDRTNIETRYYSLFSNLASGKKYKYFAGMGCTDGSTYQSPYLQWTQ